MDFGCYRVWEMVVLNLVLRLNDTAIVQYMNVGTAGARQSTTTSIGTSPGLAFDLFRFPIFE